jgi:hypothetical protein
VADAYDVDGVLISKLTSLLSHHELSSEPSFGCVNAFHLNKGAVLLRSKLDNTKPLYSV